MDTSLPACAQQKPAWPLLAGTGDSAAERCGSRQGPITASAESQHQFHRGTNTAVTLLNYLPLFCLKSRERFPWSQNNSAMAQVIFKSMLTKVYKSSSNKDLACLANYPFQHFPAFWQTRTDLKTREQKAGANLKIPHHLLSLQDEPVAFESMLKIHFANPSLLLTSWDKQQQRCSESHSHDEWAPVFRHLPDPE